MPKVIRLSDEAMSHGYTPLTSPLLGSTNVITNGEDTARLYDPYDPPQHCIYHPSHTHCHAVGEAIEGSPNVYVNDLPVHRDGDMISCGTTADHGSPNVFANSKDGTHGYPDTGGDTQDDTQGFAAGRPFVVYNPIIKVGSYDAFGGFNPRYVDVSPDDGIYTTGYTLVYGEVAIWRNYDEVGLIGNFPTYTPDVLVAPIDLTYEYDELWGMHGLTLDPDTGRIYGCPTSTGIIKVRVRHHLYDDIEDDIPGTAGDWETISLIEGVGGPPCYH